MKAKFQILYCSTAIILIGCSLSEANLVYDDGGYYDIDFYTNEDIEIYDGLTGYTTVSLVENGYADSTIIPYDNSRLFCTDGYLRTLVTRDNSVSTILGGIIGISIITEDQSEVYIHGYNFAIDDIEVDYGEIDVKWGTLTGTLINGDPLDVDLDINHFSFITLIPEPTTLLLFGLGTMILRNRNRSK